MPKPTLWTNLHLPDDARVEFERVTAGYTVIAPSRAEDSVLTPSGRDPGAARAAICYGQPDPDDLIANPGLRFVQLTSAGYTRYDREDLRRHLRDRDIPLCNASAVYDEPCAQHALAFMLCMARDLTGAWENQRRRTWDLRPLRNNSFLLSEQTVLIAGFGAIATYLAGYLKALGMTVIGFRRSPRGDEGVEVHPIDRIDQFLPRADHVMNILPAAANTRNFFDARRLAAVRPGAFFYNIGRGDTVDQPALIEALASGHLRGAYLDVTTPEPLPPDDPLWTAPNCHITPHTAGGTVDEFQRLVRHLGRNLDRFQKGESLINRII